MGRRDRRVRGVRELTAAAPFVPTNIAGIRLWLRADLGITLNGGNVSAWADQSGFGDANRNLSQVTAARQPLYDASNVGWNSRPTVTPQFTGTTWMVSGTWAPALTQPFTAFVFGQAGVGVNNFAFDGDAGGALRALVYKDLTSTYAFAGGATFPTLVIDASAQANAIVFEGNGASSVLRMNAYATSNTADAGTDGITQLTLGSRFSVGLNEQWDGPIAEMIVYNSILSQANQKRVIDYANARYGKAWAW